MAPERKKAIIGGIPVWLYRAGVFFLLTQMWNDQKEYYKTVDKHETAITVQKTVNDEVKEKQDLQHLQILNVEQACKDVDEKQTGQYNHLLNDYIMPLYTYKKQSHDRYHIN